MNFAHFEQILSSAVWYNLHFSWRVYKVVDLWSRENNEWKKNLNGQYELCFPLLSASVAKVLQFTHLNTNLKDEVSLKPGNLYFSHLIDL